MTMSRYGFVGYDTDTFETVYSAWSVDTHNTDSDGTVIRYIPTTEYAVRPVFYLTNDVYITNPEATGTSTDPFILSY